MTMKSCVLSKLKKMPRHIWRICRNSILAFYDISFPPSHALLQHSWVFQMNVTGTWKHQVSSLPIAKETTLSPLLSSDFSNSWDWSYQWSFYHLVLVHWAWFLLPNPTTDWNLSFLFACFFGLGVTSVTFLCILQPLPPTLCCLLWPLVFQGQLTEKVLLEGILLLAVC